MRVIEKTQYAAVPPPTLFYGCCCFVCVLCFGSPTTSAVFIELSLGALEVVSVLQAWILLVNKFKTDATYTIICFLFC